MTMIKSMTGFGRCEVAEGTRKITVEMKSVNHRYLDINIQRGKVDVFISYEDVAEANVCVKYNRDLAAEYMKYLWKMSEDFSLDNDVRVSTLSRYPEVLTMEEQTVDEEELWQFLEKAVRGAAEAFVETRIREGENIRDDLLSKLNAMLAGVSFIEHRAPEMIEEYRQKLRDKVKELLEDTQIDEGRLLMEVTIFADKVCVDEELVRLKSHIATTKDSLLEGGGQYDPLQNNRSGNLQQGD